MNKKFTLAIITLSDKGYRKERIDKSGPLIKEIMKTSREYSTIFEEILPDDFLLIKEKLEYLCDVQRVNLILTTGGTGFSPRDITPEATLAVAHRNVPGISEIMRANSFSITNRAVLSRGVSVIRNRTLIINLPGSPKGVKENLEFILPSLSHGLNILLQDEKECGE